MKNVLKRALLKAACCFLAVFILVTVLQYVPLIQPTWVDEFISPPSSGDYIIDRRAIIHKMGIDVLWFLYFWPFNHPQNILPSD
jgi:hypothetical protein